MPQRALLHHMGETPEDVLSGIRRALRWLVVATVVLYVALGAAAYKTYQDAGTANEALCAFRADLVSRVENSQAFLEAHPHGVAGISAAVIQRGIDQQTQTISSLSILHC